MISSDIVAYRKNCVVCDSTDLQDFYCLEKFPLLTAPTTDAIETDRFMDMDFIICNDCKCVQLCSLIDPTVLYSFDNKASLTPLWKDHHNSFAAYTKKVLEETKPENLVEIGGGSNSIFEYLGKDIEANKVIMDVYEQPEEVTSRLGASYLIGNCEHFSAYPDKTTIVMGHTFEHLYSPLDFIKSVAESPVDTVVLSVPNLRLWLLKKSTFNLLFNQHTFYFEENDMKYMFAQYGFEAVDFTMFREHSLFCTFRRSASVVPSSLNVKNDVVQPIYDHFNLKSVSIAQLNTSGHVYIMPSFYVGQIVYHYFDQKEKVLGFLDNDKNKVKKRLYGTPLSTFLPSQIQDKDDVSVVLVKTPYFAEMEKQLRELNPKANVIPLELF